MAMVNSGSPVAVRAAHLVCAVLATAIGAGGVARADDKVVVIPLSAQRLPAAEAERATAEILATIRAVPGLEVVAPRLATRDLGVDLTAQAQACDFDLFCLVEVGELLSARQVLVGHLARLPPTDPSADEGLELKLVAIDVPKASLTEVLRWRVPEDDPTAVVDAARAAARRLFAPPDVSVRWQLDPLTAEVRLYGEPLPRLDGGEPIPFWAGTYRARVTADGYEPKDVRVRLAPGRGVVDVPLTLEPDPLWVKAQGKAGDQHVFGKPSRHLGSGGSSATAGAVTDVTPSGPTPAYARIWPWAVVGAGVGLTVLGGTLMQGAQSDYDALAGETRYVSGFTLPATAAMDDRDAARSGYTVGNVLLWSGVSVALTGAVWMLVDAVLTDEAVTP